MSIKRVDFEYEINKAITGAIVEYVSNDKLSQEQMDELIEEAWQCLKREAPEALQRKRVAVVLDDAISVEHVQQYLPRGYKARIEYIDKQLSELRIVIRGYDIAGWTLDGYVIPRLGSGMIVAMEVFENDKD